MPLSLLAAFDDVIRCSRILTENTCEQEFLQFSINQEECRKQWLTAVMESRRLQEELDKANQNISSLEGKFSHARKMIDIEKKKRLEAERNCIAFEKKLNLVRELVFVEGCGKINDETKEKLGFLNTTVNSFVSNDNACQIQDRESRLHTITEAFDSTGSLLSDLSYSRSEDDLDSTLLRTGKEWKKHRASIGNEPVSAKRRRSSAVEKTIELSRTGMTTDKIVATTTVKVGKEGQPIKATAKLEAIPKNDTERYNQLKNSIPYGTLRPSAPPMEIDSTDSDENGWNQRKINPLTPRNGNHIELTPTVSGAFPLGINNKIFNRTHVFCNKTVIYPENCGPCGKRMKFGKMALKCRDCRAFCHPECKEQVPLPCVPVGSTPTQKGGVMGSIADYAPPIPPMVPAIIVHCVNEVELRGLNEVGIYRVPGSDKDVKSLKEKFLRGKGVPCLSKLDIHVVCCTMKDFLRSLNEPLVIQSLWKDFVKAAENPDPEDGKVAMYQAISKLPQPNRDTLSFLIMHLQRVAECLDCKMPASNLAKVFGPTIVGYSSLDPEPMTMLHETKKQTLVLEHLMSIPNDYWANFVNVDSGLGTNPPSEIYLTPSTECLLPYSGSSLHNNMTPYSSRSRTRNRKFFPTPPK